MISKLASMGSRNPNRKKKGRTEGMIGGRGGKRDNLPSYYPRKKQRTDARQGVHAAPDVMAKGRKGGGALGRVVTQSSPFPFIKSLGSAPRRAA